MELHTRKKGSSGYSTTSPKARLATIRLSSIQPAKRVAIAVIEIIAMPMAFADFECFDRPDELCCLH
jgi:hypothetical protein